MLVSFCRFIKPSPGKYKLNKLPPRLKREIQMWLTFLRMTTFYSSRFQISNCDVDGQIRPSISIHGAIFAAAMPVLAPKTMIPMELKQHAIAH